MNNIAEMADIATWIFSCVLMGAVSIVIILLAVAAAIQLIKDLREKEADSVCRCETCIYCKKDKHWKMLYCDKMSDDEHTHWVKKDFYCGFGKRRK